MAIAINFSQAVKLFINHLNKGNVEEKWIKIYKQSLQGPFKRLIAGGFLSLIKFWVLCKMSENSFQVCMSLFHLF